MKRVVQMTKEHFEVHETFAFDGFLKEARQIINRQQGFASLNFGGEQYVLAFWWGTTGPTFCLLAEEREGELIGGELENWLEKAESRFRQSGFGFQVRKPRNKELAIKELASALSFREVPPSGDPE
jgi:hypothetical protein